MSEQRCVICAWRENCAKRFSVSDGGARCPDYSRDVSLQTPHAESDQDRTVKEFKK